MEANGAYGERRKCMVMVGSRQYMDRFKTEKIEKVRARITGWRGKVMLKQYGKSKDETWCEKVNDDMKRKGQRDEREET